MHYCVPTKHRIADAEFSQNMSELPKEFKSQIIMFFQKDVTWLLYPAEMPPTDLGAFRA